MQFLKFFLILFGLATVDLLAENTRWNGNYNGAEGSVDVFETAKPDKGKSKTRKHDEEGSSQQNTNEFGGGYDGAEGSVDAFVPAQSRVDEETRILTPDAIRNRLDEHMECGETIKYIRDSAGAQDISPEPISTPINRQSIRNVAYNIGLNNGKPGVFFYEQGIHFCPLPESWDLMKGTDGKDRVFSCRVENGFYWNLQFDCQQAKYPYGGQGTQLLTVNCQINEIPSSDYRQMKATPVFTEKALLYFGSRIGSVMTMIQESGKFTTFIENQNFGVLVENGRSREVQRERALNRVHLILKPLIAGLKRCQLVPWADHAAGKIATQWIAELKAAANKIYPKEKFDY